MRRKADLPLPAHGRPPLARDRRGATMVEFALILPVMMMLMLGGIDIALRIYVRSLLEGEMAKAGRDNSLELGTNSTNQTNIDTRVRTQVQNVVSTATVTFARTAFSSYTRVQSRAEPFIDANANGTCDNGETYEDSNRSGGWNSDSGLTGAGGANDAQLYTATVSYPSLFPLQGMLGQSQTISMTASTVLLNQPYSEQSAIVNRTCT